MLDEIDQNILKILQSQGDITNHELGERAFISPSQAGRRKARLEEHGYISGYKAKVNAERVDLKIQAFIQLALKQHGKAYADHQYLDPDRAGRLPAAGLLPRSERAEQLDP